MLKKQVTLSSSMKGKTKEDLKLFPNRKFHCCNLKGCIRVVEETPYFNHNVIMNKFK